LPCCANLNRVTLAWKEARITTLELKPAHKPVQNYYAALRQFEELGVRHESAVRSAFQSLLALCARQHDWTLVPEWEIRRQRRMLLRVDGALVDDFRLTHGFWEAKDIRDDLRREVRRKFDAGYPRDNILFQTPRRAPGIFQVMRGIIDRRRRKGIRVGEFLLLGSASMDLLKQSAESLAGRIAYLGDQYIQHGRRKNDGDFIGAWIDPAPLRARLSKVQ
jgi:hypothetical protein